MVCAVAMAVLPMVADALNPSWQAQVDEAIAKGEFTYAEQLMASLPASTRRADAVVIDSLSTIMQRIRGDFNLKPADGVDQIRQRMPEVSDSQIAQWKRQRKLEVMTIDGQEWWFRKSVRNLWLLGDEFAQANAANRNQSLTTRLQYFREAMNHPANKYGVRDWRRVNITFTLDVKADAVPAGELLRVWLPFPYENLRQRNIELLASNRPVTYSQGSLHHTLYMEAVAEAGQATHFEYTFSYEVGERHLAQQDLLALVLPYDTSSELYRRYTASEGRHIVITDRLRDQARAIVGDEQNPVLQAAKLYEWIGQTLPWAGAREYSTIANIPEYVLANGHGDCGQVALLYITMARALGIPARWESGYMLHPGEVNYHDWAETYFEGVGWVPTDPSFGRSAVGTVMNDYYATGIDVYRLATNEGIGDSLYPPKTYIRSETVDFQPGEVEWRGGNLFYDQWDSHLEVNEIVPLAD